MHRKERHLGPPQQASVASYALRSHRIVRLGRS